MGTLITMKSRTKPKRYDEFNQVVRNEGAAEGRRFLTVLELKGSEWAVWIDYCSSWDSPACRVFRAYLAE